jgi:uncharacterized protein YgiM (DUF1202 family)
VQRNPGAGNPFSFDVDGGTEITVLQVIDIIGVDWYQVDLPEGEDGWVASDNLTVEIPE